MNDERLLPTSEAARYLGLDSGTLKRWRTKGTNPPLPYVKVSANRCRYSLEALKAFVTERTRQHTADPGPSATLSLPIPTKSPRAASAARPSLSKIRRRSNARAA